MSKKESQLEWRKRVKSSDLVGITFSKRWRRRHPAKAICCYSFFCGKSREQILISILNWIKTWIRMSSSSPSSSSLGGSLEVHVLCECARSKGDVPTIRREWECLFCPGPTLLGKSDGWRIWLRLSVVAVAFASIHPAFHFGWIANSVPTILIDGFALWIECNLVSCDLE